MKLALLSDTHMRHRSIAVPEVDVVVHAGDFSRRGTRDEALAFLRWFSALPAGAKVLTAGNHEYWAEADPAGMRALARAHGVTYLEGEAADVAGLRVWGSPITPTFGRMAFNRPRGAPIRAHWEAIPAGLDLLVTHGPPRGAGDRTFFGMRVGCADLLDVVRERRPAVHVFGHIHEGAGEARVAGVGTRFLNVASSRLLGGTRPPVVIDL